MNVRNIGICAHIDAGKTTLTERILYYTGKKHKIGEVHDGEATMDWMDQEKERGITINSACITVNWKKTKINIIDTPGHVDFTAEVERSTRVLDGVCVVFCAVAGVQAQSETVWRQINKYKIPRIVFVNKMDRVGSNYDKVCEDISKKLSIKVIKVHYPIYIKEKFNYIIDLIEMEIIKYEEKTKGIKLIKKKIPERYINESIKRREEMIENLIENEDKYIDKYIKGKIDKKDIYKIIRKKTIKLKISPALCGSAFKNKGIQNILDSFKKYLPKPNEKKIKYIDKKNKKKTIKKKEKNFSAFVFKIINDNFSGKLSYIRIYSGKIKIGDIINNSRNKKKFKISRIIEVNAKNKIDINKAKSGDIVALVAKDILTGDTLFKKSFFCFEKIDFPEPVISYKIETKEYSELEKITRILKKSSVEDPTIKIKVDENGKTLISGMGELHIDVFIEKIKREYNLNFYKTKPQVSYRETITKESKNVEGKYIRQSGGRGQYGQVFINVFPRKIGKGIKIVNKIKGGSIPKEFIKPIIKSFEKTLQKGVIYGYKVVDIKIELIYGTFHEVDSSENSFSIAASMALKNALKISEPVILEPIMKVTIFTPFEYIGNIISNISKKKGIIYKNESISKLNLIKCYVPMSKMFGYSTELRSYSKGRATFNMEFAYYKKK